MRGLITTAVLVAASTSTTRGAEAFDGENATCFLLKQHTSAAAQFNYSYKTPSKPFPSLTQCYKNNQGACCVSAHDAFIEAEYANILSTTCLRQFTYLEQYFCLGCNPDQGKWVVGNEYTYQESGGSAVTDANGMPAWNFDMRICTSFMQFLFDPDQDEFNYDNCGLLEDGVGYLPTARYKNASVFVQNIKPPYFDHVNWVEVDDTHELDADCYVPEKETVRVCPSKRSEQNMDQKS